MSALDAITLTRGSTLEMPVAANLADPGPGTIHVAAITLQTPPSNDFVLATITFRAKTSTSGSALNLLDNGSHVSAAYLGGEPVLGSVENGTVVIAEPSAVLVGTISPQAKDVAANWTKPIQISVAPISGGASLSATVTPDANGVFTLNVATVGTYTIKAKAANSLRNSRTVQIVRGINRFGFGELRTGDVNNDNQVRIQDFSLLAHTYNKAIGESGFDARADLDSSGRINIRDFSLMATNYNRSGDIEVNTNVERHVEPIPPPSASLSLLSASTQVSVGQVFEVSIVAGTVEPGLDGIAFALKIDPVRFEVINLTPTESLPLILHSNINAEAGAISFASGTYEPLPAGNHVLATIQMRSLQAGPASISFVNDSVVSTEMYSSGNPIFVEHTLPLFLTVGHGIPTPDSQYTRIFLPIVRSQNN